LRWRATPATEFSEPKRSGLGEKQTGWLRVLVFVAFLHLDTVFLHLINLSAALWWHNYKVSCFGRCNGYAVIAVEELETMMKKASFLLLLVLCGASLSVNAQIIFKCVQPNGRIVYSDSKCNPPEKGGRLKLIHNVMDSPGSNRETGFRSGGSGNQILVPYVEEENTTTDPVENIRWDGNSEKFVVYPFLGSGVYTKR
jgi:hypothetical protein